jgi:hypothetical protein
MKKEMLAALAKSGEMMDFTIGETIYIRTITYHHTGRVIAETPLFVILEDAAWIAESARWADAIKTGALNEVEPVDVPVRVAKAAIVDITPWLHPLPRTQK